MVRDMATPHTLSILNGRPSIVHGPDLLHNLVRPSDCHATAIDFLEHGSTRRKYSYKTLHDLSDALAARITRTLAKLESASPIIPIFLPQSPELYIAILAVLKAGKAFCPLNLDTPIERLNFILGDISAHLLITLPGLEGRVRAATSIQVLSADHELPLADKTFVVNLPKITTNDLAYVLYTSGSTGLPKAVSVSHRAVTQSLLAHDRHIPAFARFLQFAAPTFDVSIFEIFFPWFRGRTLVGCTRAQMLDDLPAAISQLGVDAAELTPTVVGNLLGGRSSVPCLKLLLTIGEMLTQHVVDEYGGNDTKESMLWAMYGPTEAAIHCTLQSRFSTSASTGVIGYPLDTVSVFIIAIPTGSHDRCPIEILPVGETGELAIGGPQIAEEYLHRPDLTSASFVEHREYGRLYRTGDRARLNQDRTLQCLGRVVDGQVKLRGQRVELGEIEDAVLRASGCRSTTVMIIQESLVAFCAVGSRKVTRTDVIETCKRWLPAFMIPKDIRFINNMPQLPSGKIDKGLLEQQYIQSLHSNGGSGSVTSVLTDPTSQSVARIFRAYTSKEVGVESDLALSGLDSLRSIRIASALRQEGFVIGAMEVLSASTLRDLIELCKDRKSLNGLHAPEKDLASTLNHEHILQLKPWHRDIAIALHCTPLQEAMLAETIIRPSAYCNWVEVKLPVARTFAEIQDALRSLANANEILRTGFYTMSETSSTFIQIIWKELSASQIREVTSFSRAFSMESYDSLLRPFTVQVVASPMQPSRLLFQIHHALYDGWSFDLLLQDLDKYLRKDVVTPRPQFRNVVDHVTHHAQSDEHSRALEYWASLLSDYAPISLPNYNGKLVSDASVRHFSGRSTVDRHTLFQHARELAINPQVFYQSATAYILGLYSGSDDVVFGNVTSGRTIPVTGVENIIGPCIASVPFRIDLQGLVRVRDLLQKTQTLNRDSLHHSTLPLRDIARAANVLPGSRLFNVLFVWQQSITTDTDTDSSLAARIVDSADELEFGVTMEFEPRKDCISFRATFDASIIPECQIRYLSQQIDELVQLFLVDVDCDIGRIKNSFTTASLSIANPSPSQQPIRQPPSHAVEQWATRDPDRKAITIGHVVNGVMEIGEVATYGMLNARANQFARVLLEHGAGHDQLVAIIMDKSIDLYVSILAVLKLGCGYLPLVPDTPIERVKAILSDAQVAVCISESSISSALRASVSVDFVDCDLISVVDCSTDNLNVPYNGQHLAYAVFTSGSTGTPKGVLVTQDNLMSNLEYLSAVYPYSEDSCLLQSCSQAFDVSVFEIFFSWYTGMNMCTAKKDDLFRDFEASINRLQITHLSLTPTVAALVDPNNVPKVEFMVTAGEALTENVRRRWAGKGLYQGYGPSETTNICTVRADVTPEDLINNIGPPFRNTSAFVLDPESHSILPRGAVGELCFGGFQVFRGYLNRPELNADKIIDHPIYGRIYRSGDMGIMLPDDSILSTGRSDDQVKIRGQRVELGEITSVILDNEAVQDCVTLLVQSSGEARLLATFWVPLECTGNTCDALKPEDFEAVTSEVFDLLSRRLPSYMMPSHIIPISCVPMTAQAKVDKRLLQRLFDQLDESTLLRATRAQHTGDEAEPSSQWEKDVAEILAQTLDVPPNELRRTSSFFNVGLDSVSAIRFCNELRRVRLADFSVSEVLRNPSIAHLSSLQMSQLSSQHLAKPATDLTNIFSPDQTSQIFARFQQRDLHVSRILPCTPLQEAMLSTGQSSSGSAYSNVMVFDVKGDLSRLQASWSGMVQRHEILRTSFVSTEDPSHAFAQVILQESNIVWHKHSLDHGVQSRTNDTITGLLDDEKPPIYFALETGYAFTKLLFCCHHALYDGIAISTLIKEVQDMYHGCELPSPVASDIYLQHLLDQDLTQADEYWAALLKDYEPTYFPNLTGKTMRAQGSAASVSRNLDTPLSVARTACQDAAISLLSVVQATWAKLLHFYTGENDLCFGNVVNGRSIPGENLDRLVAPCFNTLPVRINFDFSKTNKSLVSLMNGINSESLAYQLTPLRRIQNLAVKEEGRLFDTLVILQQSTLRLDEAIWTLEQDLGDMDLPVVCEIVQDQAKDLLKLVLHYNTSLLSGAEASLVAETFENCFGSLLKFPQASAGEVSRLPARLRADSNMTFQRFDTNASLLHSGFESNATSYSGRIALDFLHSDGMRTTWSFRTLNEKANAIAHALISKGTKPEDIVPVHTVKSPEFYASILGVLKAGSAFAPVNPELPEARRKLMFTELKPKLVLCTSACRPSMGLTGAEIVNVETIEPSQDSDPIIYGLKDSNLAYCLFTSGSTGVPKAVSMEHRAPIQTIKSSESLVPWQFSSRLLQYAAITFDMCYYDCFLAWTFGFTLCAADQHEMLNDLPKMINTLEVDLLDLTPSVAVSLKKADVPKVQWLYCIGEAMSSEITKEWGGVCVNSYGPTEAAFCTTIHPVSSRTSTAIIGKPFPTTSFAVFAPRIDHPLPILSVGELYIGGTQLARGYLGKSDLTNDRFVDRCGQRFYKSGDMVRMLSDGNFEFVGRADEQVKIRGLRVELGEISHVLRDASPEVVSVTTQLLENNVTASKQLVAFLVLRKNIEVCKQAGVQQSLKRAAASRLPSYMVPHLFLFVDEIPRSMAGKIDKSALAKIFHESSGTDLLLNGSVTQTSEHRWTSLEKQVRDVLARLSKTSIDKILPTTTIHQLGLDSISAVQIAAALRRQGHNVKATDVLKNTTCIQLAEFIGQIAGSEAPRAQQFDFEAYEHKHREAVLREYGIKSSNITAIRPCTPVQNGMVSQFLGKDGAVYMNYVRMQLEPTLDLDRLREAWGTAMEHHSILRTGFVHVKRASHTFAMCIYAPAAAVLPWSVVAVDEPAGLVDEWLYHVQQRALHRLHSPPWQIRVVKNSHMYLDIAIFHALFDAQSIQSIFVDVAAIYRGQRLQPPKSLDPVIGNIILSSERGTRSGDDFWADLGKRAASLCRFPNLAPLRYDPIPPAMCTKQSKEPLAVLETRCRDANVTLQAAGIASWLSLLSAYTGERSVTCGVVLSGRTSEPAENAVFPCINTVPIACTVSDDRSAVLRTVMELNANIQQYQFTPLNEIQRLMGFPNESLFDTIFAYQKLSSPMDVGSLWTMVDEKASIEYPISIELEPKGGGLEYRLTFLPHVIPKEQASLILDQLDHLLESFLMNAGLTATESSFSEQLYSITPAKVSEIPSEARFLHGLVESTAQKFPQRIAFEFVSAKEIGDRSVEQWTYSELDAEGNRLARLLTVNGIMPGSLVGVCFEKCPEASFAILGILKAGCAFVAIDPGAPAARQAFMVKDSQARAVLSMSAQSSRFASDIDVPTLNLDETDWRSHSSSKVFHGHEISPQDRAYCLYTSGTTGTPKGCELTHENSVQALLAFQRLFAGHWNTESRWLQFASFHFDVSVLEQYWSWSVGICVVSAPRDLIFEDLAKSIHDLRITHLDLTPSLAQVLHPDDVPDLCKGVFITGGESLKQEILDIWGPKSVIYNGYGPTEATIGCTMYPRVPANGKPSNIGPQFDNVGSVVLQPGSDIPVLRGGVGELCVSGKLVGKGYLNRPELTAERFPYLERFEERVYRTGDLVRILHDGAFDFLGRADDQVKLRGQRLEVGEINSVIKQSGGNISDVATLVLKHPKQQKEQLVVFLVRGKATRAEPQILLDSTDDVANAKEACHEKLPPYMVPTHFIPLSAMPLNVNNKADAKKLRDLYEHLSSNDLQKLSVTPNVKDQTWSEQERKLCLVLAQTLDTEPESIGKDTSFFELGMDSISVISVSRSIKLAGFMEASASVIMRCPTVRRLAKVLMTNNITENDRGSILAAQQAINATQHRYKRTVAQILSIDASAIEALAPCTPLQQGMIAKSLESDTGLYFNTFRFNLYDDIDEQKLQSAWDNVHQSTQILRTVFVHTEEGYVQAVLRKITFPGLIQATVDHGQLSKYLTTQRTMWLELNRTELGRPFEVHLVATQTQKLLVVHVFHGLYDGNSIGLVFKDVWSAYNGTRPETGIPTFHHALAHGPLRKVEGAKKFWQDHVSIKTPPLPVTIDVPSHNSIVATRGIRNLAYFESVRRQLNVTAQAIAQACWLSVLQQHIKGSVTMGMVVSGRSIDLEDADRVIGPMFNTIPYQYRAQHNEPWASIIKRVHQFNIDAHTYQHTPLRDIIKWCKRSPSQKLFDNLFVYQIGQDDGQWAKNSAWEIVDGGAVADYPLAFEVNQQANNDLKLTLVAQGHVLDEQIANELLDRFESAVQQVLRDPSAICELSVETDGDLENETSVEIQETRDADGESHFDWTKEAVKIREEISNLAGVKMQDISATTAIFELGLDSIDAIKLSSKLKKHGITLPVSKIMRGLTIAKMMESVSSRDEGVEEKSSRSNLQDYKQKLTRCLGRFPSEISDIEDVLPLTPLQEAMVAEMVASEYARYYNFDVLEIDRSTDIKQLQKAWKTVIEGSPILRTGFVEVGDPEVDDSFAQVIHRHSHNFWSQIDTEGAPDYISLFDRLRSDAIRTSLTSPPLRITLVNSPSRSYLVLSIAHALYDGYSLGLLHSDVRHAYCNQFSSRPNYDSALADIITTSGSDAAEFWQDYLGGASVGSFPRRPNVSSETCNAVHRHQQDSAVALVELQSFAKKINISLQTIGQTVFAMASASYTESLDVTFGSVLSGRDEDERSQLLFPTMNTVAIRTILHGTCIELLGYVQNNFTNIKQWQHYPLRKALSQASVDGRLLESLFIYQKSIEEAETDEKKLYRSVEGHSDVEYPVCVEMEVVNGTLVWRCAVKEEVFDQEGSKDLLKRMDEVLRYIMGAPDASVIEVTADGTSICGLPAFQPRENKNAKRPVDAEDASHEDAVYLETASKICEVLAAVSKTPEDEIMKDMNIFHLGLDSISAIKVSSLLRKKGVVLSVGEMLRAGTITKMAAVVDGRATEPSDKSDESQLIIQEALKDCNREKILDRIDIDKANVADILPITAGQLYMLSMWLNTKGGNFYPTFTYRVQGDTPVDILRKAWQSLVASNSILRTSFVSTSDQQIPYVQVISNGTSSSFNDVTGMEKHEVNDHIERTKTSQPWVHVFTSRTSSGWELKLKIHHALYDGVSLPLLMEQLQGLCSDTHARPPTNTFAKLIANSHVPSAVQERKTFWTKYLANVSEKSFLQPSTTPMCKTEIFEPALLNTASLEALARRHGTSTQSLFLAVYSRLYATMTHTAKEADAIIGVYLANRSLPINDITSTPIPTVNLLPLRITSPLTHDVWQTAVRIQNDLQAISEPVNASASLFEICEWTGIKIDTFVNLLTLPGTVEEEMNDEKEDERVKLMPFEQWGESVHRVVDVEGLILDRAPEVMHHGRVQNAYLHAIDVEATIRSGALDVGIFAPTSMLGLEAGQRLVEDLKKELEGVI